ncbi:MAG: BatA domain-containing protein, partial [Phycisphaerae bacterium]
MNEALSMLDPVISLLAAVPFVHPSLAGAAVAVAAIPWIIHLINRRRYKRVRWAAMGFLLAANQKSLRRIRLENWLLLLVRTLVISGLALAVARPFFSGGTLLGLGDATRHHILLIDNSLSATARDTPSAEEEIGLATVSAALKLMSSVPRSDALSVVTLASPAQPLLDHAAYDRRLIRQQVGRIRPTQRATDLAGGLTAALQILVDSPSAPENRVVYLISDQADTAWRTAGSTAKPDRHPAVVAARRVSESAKLVLVPTTGPQRDNLAVTELRSLEGLPGIGRPIRLTTTVTNFGRRPASGVTLQARRGDRIERRLALPMIEPGASRDLTFSIQADQAGPLGLELRLDAPAPDALPADNLRTCSLQVFDSVPVLLVDGRPGAGRFEGQTGYLSTALSPVSQPGETSLLSPKTITELELAGEVLAGYRLIVLCNVQRLEETVWARLTEFVSDGGGLLIFTGDAVNASNYNRYGHAAGDGVLPGKLGQP